MTTNPATIPGVTLDLKPSQGLQFMYIEVIQHVNMDRPRQPCALQEDYSFTTCVKNSVARKVGCRYSRILSDPLANLRSELYVPLFRQTILPPPFIN